MKTETSISPSQAAAISFAARLGLKLQKEFPQIAQLYASGKTQPQIVELLGLKNKYGLRSLQTGVTAVCFALRGFEGNEKCQAYSGILKEQDLRELCIGHRSAPGKRMHVEHKGTFGLSAEEQARIKKVGGSAVKEQKKGIFALSREERGNNNRRNYLNGNSWWAKLTTEQRKEHGRKLHQDGVGIHALTSSQKKEAGLKGLNSMGMTPWSEAEDKFLLEVSKSTNWLIVGQGLRRRDYDRIVLQLNKEFHGGIQTRTKIATRDRLILCSGNIPTGEATTFGPVGWSKSEEAFLVGAIQSGRYRIEYKSNRLTYDYDKLAEELNLEFHQGAMVRTRSGTRKKVLTLQQNIAQ